MTIQTGAIAFRSMTVQDIPFVAEMHAGYIGDSVFSEFGTMFLRAIYGGMQDSPYGLVYICETDSEKIGFICAAIDTGKLMQDILIKKCILLSAAVAGHVLMNPKKLWIIIETFLYTRRTAMHCINTELLFVALKPAHRGKDIGGQLCRMVLSKLQSTGVRKVKVTVVEHNREAESHLRKCGFSKEASFGLYGIKRNLFTCDIPE